MILGFSSIGCASGLGYTKDIKAIRGISEIQIIADATITEDVVGSNDLIDVPKSIGFGMAAVDELSANLRDKGYTVSKGFVSSVGGSLNEFSEYKVFATVKDRSFTTIGRDLSTPPFHLNKAFRKKEKKTSLLTLHRDLAQKKRGKLPMLQDLGIEGRALLVVQIDGYQGSTIKRAGKLVGSLVLAKKRIRVRPEDEAEDNVEVRLYMVDMEKGEVVWASMESDETEPTSTKAKSTARGAIAKFPMKK